jgi:ABC-type branched-subunit amino acid transport system ATPase component
VGMLAMVPMFLVGGVAISSAGKFISRDIENVWTTSAALSEVAAQRRNGSTKRLLVRNLEVSYGDVQVLFGVDLEVGEGEIVALLGTNGAGKSTLLRAISGVVEADKGAVILDGRDVTHAPPNEIAARGVVQVPGGQGVFPSLTVAENLRTAGWLVRGDRRTVDARMAQVFAAFPVLERRVDEPAANLSGGQQQMLALGMALVQGPTLVLIDELSLGLAPVVVEQLVPMVQTMRDNGATVVVVEQSVNVALTLADEAYFMEKGQIRFRGPTAELLDRPDVLRSVFLEGASSGMALRSSPVAGRDGVDPQQPVSEPERPSGPADRPALAVTAVNRRFGGILAVDDVSLSVAPGEILGIIGPNGAGKTTLFDLISGFVAVDSGAVFLDGSDVTAMTAPGRAQMGLGRSFQDARLFPGLTVEDTIKVSLDRWIAVRDPVLAALHMPAVFDSEADVTTRTNELIELLGLEAFRSKFVRELSTGSRRIVDLACIVAHRPSVVLFDEPSSGIAQRETEALAPVITRVAADLGAAVVIIEHDMPLVSAVADRLLALDQGRVVTSGSVDFVLHHPEVVASYLGTTRKIIERSGKSR